MPLSSSVVSGSSNAQRYAIPQPSDAAQPTSPAVSAPSDQTDPNAELNLMMEDGIAGLGGSVVSGVSAALASSPPATTPATDSGAAASVTGNAAPATTGGPACDAATSISQAYASSSAPQHIIRD